MPQPATFHYYEVRPVIDDGADCFSFVDEAAFEAERDTLRADDAKIETMWTIYGVLADGTTQAIGDFTDKQSAHQVLNAMLAPLAAARDFLEAASVGHTGNAMLKERITAASSLIDDFINQCSNEERI